VNFHHGFFRRDLYALIDVNYPFFPVSAGSYRLQQPVVILLVFDNKSARINDRLVQKALQDKKKYIYNTACPTVAIVERMYALELVMLDCQFDKR
jgi:hypothetical protein